MYDHGTLDARDPTLTRLDGGTIVCTFFLHDGTAATAYTMRSTDNGATFDTPVEVTTSLTETVGVSGPVVELSDGTLLVALYGTDATMTLQSAVCCRSTDDGDTWAELATIGDGDGDGRHYQEPYLVLLDNSDLLCLLRTDGAGATHYSSRSTDDGASWTSPAATGVTGDGRPAAVQLSNGALVFTYRTITVQALRTSWDHGATWTAASGIGTAGQWGAYAQPVEIGTSKKCAVVYALQASETEADVFFTYVYPYEVDDPLA